jgi:hypothetical protein
MIALRLFGHETDANHIREESRRSHLDLHDGLCDWRDDLRTLTCDGCAGRRTLRRLRLRAHRSSALPPHYGAGMELSAPAPGNSAAPFPPLRVVRQKWANTPNNEWRD